MTAIGQALTLVRELEGCRLRAYRDTGGAWTIGWGHKLPPDDNHGLAWSQEQADAVLESDIGAVAERVSNLVKTALTASQTAALISLAYNVGCNALAGSSLIGKVNAGLWIEAAKAFLAWDHIKGVEDRGLLRRRMVEAATFLAGSP